MGATKTDVTSNAGSPQLFQARVRERDLDNFLVEELQSSTAFREWFLSRLSQSFAAPDDCELRLQKSPSRLLDARQTDVRVGWFDNLGELTACVLIESKVTEDFQPGQAEAYAEERDGYRVRLGHVRASAVIVAPVQKLSRLPHARHFDHAISVEEMIDALATRRRDEALCDELDARLAVRIEILESLCGKRSARGWIAATVPEKRSFALAYADLASAAVPLLSLRPSTDGRKAFTRIFEGLPIPHGFPRTVIRHEFGSNEKWKYVNLQIAGAADRATALLASGLIEGTRFSVVEAGKSLSIRVSVPGINPTHAFDEQEPKVRLGLEAVEELFVWFQKHRDEVAQIILE